MAEIDLKVAGEQLKALGPTEEHRQQFGKTFLGSLMGQTIVLIGMVVAYLAALALLWRYASEDLKGLREALGDFWFYLALALPFAVIFLFSMLPTGIRALREQHLKNLAIGGAAQFAPGYFRLYPYGAMDRDQFVRRDGMDATVLTWLQTAKDSILYLSGASGSGKSSLLAASVLPKLRDMNWAVVETRAFGDPVERLRDALAGHAPAKQGSLRDLLTAAAKAQAQKKSAGPLLIVIDQFEEFLILQTPENQKALAALLKDLAKNPIKGLKLLLVFRSDYRPLIFKSELPPLSAGSNWQEVGAYSRGEAEVFLQGGGRTFSQQNLDALFKGLDGIEDARQLYRLVTLNMVGLVLEKMGRDFSGDAARLIQSYLSDCLTSRDIQDYAKPVLSAMISEAGTKVPLTESEVSKLTGLVPWQVSATIAGLAQQGLVRRLDGKEPVWEIAHDFLARMLGQLIGRLRPTLFQLTQPILAPLLLSGWLAAGSLGITHWSLIQLSTAIGELRGLGARVSKTEDGGYDVDFDRMPEQDTLDDSRLEEAIAHLAILPGLELDLWNASITTLAPLQTLTNTRYLSLDNSPDVDDLKYLANFHDLRKLKLGRVDGLSLV